MIIHDLPVRRRAFRLLTSGAAALLGITGVAGPLVMGIFLAPAANAALTDTDGDGLPDVWETQGYDADGNGVIDVDLPAMGADPRRKDLFVEMEYMQGRLPSAAALDRMRKVFAPAPVSNPDGTSGITLHLDAGSASGTTYDLGGGNQVPYDDDLNPSQSEVNAIKRTNFDSDRAKIFRYMLWGDSYDGGCSSGVAFGIPGDTFIATVGPKCNWRATDNVQVGTFVHELGHTLGLRHGGTDNANYKPNYLSVMNYSFQLGGVPKADGSLYFGYSNIAPAALNESSLRESNGLGSIAAAWRTSYFCPDRTKRTTSASADRPIDWNCDGSISSGSISADINNDNNRSTQTAQNNWASLSFSGGSVGAGASSNSSLPAPELAPEPELTKAQWDLLQRDIRP
ncbi:hypothetical protein ODZ83_00975 [Acaricomes phytoseiuli]|uniref:hypothetical protein n=1 Tax=Acaricomes phytoseiuli TaxID=291968 RepID=UPI00222339C5|nr:hypothetical protein [Acaricomes phytoseiuli]MCW1248784.1 hypothetical protein [Acaricomes phytoseiuli]